MGRKIYCPLPEYREAWVELPPEWLGLHAKQRDEVAENKGELSSTELNFAIAIALLDNWDLPGLGGNPENWDFSQLSLPLIAWINQEVLTSFTACFLVPKGLSSPLSTGSMAGEQENQAGDLEKAL